MTQLINKFSVIIILSLLPFSIYAQTESHQLSTHILDISKGEPAQGVDRKSGELFICRWS